MFFLSYEHYWNKAPYKVEPELKDSSKIIKECEEVEGTHEIEPLGETECPITPEAEL